MSDEDFVEDEGTDPTLFADRDVDEDEEEEIPGKK